MKTLEELRFAIDEAVHDTVPFVEARQTMEKITRLLIAYEAREAKKNAALAKLIANHRKARRLLLDLTNMTEPMVRGKFNEDIDALYAEIDEFLPRHESTYGREQRTGEHPRDPEKPKIMELQTNATLEALMPDRAPDVSLFHRLFKKPDTEKLAKLIEAEVKQVLTEASITELAQLDDATLARIEDKIHELLMREGGLSKSEVSEVTAHFHGTITEEMRKKRIMPDIEFTVSGPLAEQMKQHPEYEAYVIKHRDAPSNAEPIVLTFGEREPKPDDPPELHEHPPVEGAVIIGVPDPRVTAHCGRTRCITTMEGGTDRKTTCACPCDTCLSSKREEIVKEVQSVNAELEPKHQGTCAVYDFDPEEQLGTDKECDCEHLEGCRCIECRMPF